MAQIRRIISINNIGRFRQSAATPNPGFQKYNFVFGPNAYGKSTLCAILRSAASGETEELSGRKTLRSTDPISIQILTDTGQLTLNNSTWSATLPISVFDAAFVQQNVFSGDMVGVDNRRALYRIIVGREGASLAEEEAWLTERIRAKQTEVKAAQQVIEAQSAGLKSADYVKLVPDEQVDQKIDEQKKLLESIAASAEVARRRPLSSLRRLEDPRIRCGTSQPRARCYGT